MEPCQAVLNTHKHLKIELMKDTSIAAPCEEAKPVQSWVCIRWFTGSCQSEGKGRTEAIVNKTTFQLYFSSCHKVLLTAAGNQNEGKGLVLTAAMRGREDGDR